MTARQRRRGGKNWQNRYSRQSLPRRAKTAAGSGDCGLWADRETEWGCRVNSGGGRRGVFDARGQTRFLLHNSVGFAPRGGRKCLEMTGKGGMGGQESVYFEAGKEAGKGTGVILISRVVFWGGRAGGMCVRGPFAARLCPTNLRCRRVDRAVRCGESLRVRPRSVAR